ncbi:MAG TPA: hypothetical protein VLR29_11995, partial [Flavobacterium sp.]|nr:hypothetical protein [Flavobacterium sp.]
MKTTILIPIIFCFFNICLTAQTGCTDPQALNYDSNAVTNNGNCFYSNASVSPSSSTNLSAAIDETSGLIEWNNFLYTHNDNTDTKIYKLDKLTGAILQDIPLNTLLNIDWEEISQDENFIYLGDFGNNYSGNRTNLKIYKIAKAGFETSPQIEIINFSYSNQTDFTAQDSNKTDFDCEAFVVTQNEILLFTKQWLSGKTSIYSLSKTPGTFVANLVTTIDVAG